MAEPSTARRLTLAGACTGAFTERTRRKGREHIERGEAAIEGATDETVLVFVRGDRPKPFLTAVDVAEVENRERVRVECSCPYFRDGYPCEHIYAALLAMDASGLDLVSASDLRGRLDVVPYKAGLPADDDWFFEGDNAFASAQKVAEAFFEAQGRHREPDWRSALQTLERGLIANNPSVESVLGRTPIERVEFRIQPEKSEDRGVLVVETFQRIPDPEHPTGRLEPLLITRRDLDRVARAEDRRALDLLLAHPLSAGLIRPSDPGVAPLASNLTVVPAVLYDVMLNALVATARFRCPLDEEGLRTTPPLERDTGEPWSFVARLDEDEGRGRFSGWLRRGDDLRSLGDATLVVRDGLVIFDDAISALDVGDDYDWLKFLRRNGPITFAPDKAEEVMRRLAQIDHLPALEIALEPYAVIRPPFRPRVFFGKADPKTRNVEAEVSFDYEGTVFGLNEEASAALVGERFVPRRRGDERDALRELGRIGLKAEEGVIVAKASEVDGIIRRVAQGGFDVRADGRGVRPLTGQTFKITSGVDWFDLQGEIDFEGQKVSLPEVLQAVRERNGLVRLEDGSEGLISEQWLHRIGALGRLGQKKPGKLRFAPGQVLLLDGLLQETELEADDRFARAQAQLSGTTQIDPISEPDAFLGELRPYQRNGLGWLDFLDQTGLGGCLADDMGLGKTIQVLALLSKRKSEGRARGPSLLVAPRSLVYNWLREAERFVPDLSVLDYTGSQRSELTGALAGVDLVVTTYGTVRRDVDILRETTFDYLILDEAQAVKNPSAQSSKACRLLRGSRRLALSGTPVENDAVELWSIFEFLNPRMLGSRQQFHAMSREGGTLPMVARALKPLLLRRTKSQVLKDLPEKTELSIHCELSSSERETYERLRDHYRASIHDKVEQEGLSKSRMHVLEALLRLRQAACHPGLIDPKRVDESSSKLETVLDQVREVIAEGHKALIFSQFVKLLGIVRSKLDAEGVKYAYLDGQTTDRESRVRQFMEDDDTRLFLISLKAGGLGLNLTAADYVFILDPWWNPAVEAQAIDRAHRIGQTRPVFAYRIVARDTVEEKIIELHAHKRKLADALVSADDQFMRELTLDDLRMLFGA